MSLRLTCLLLLIPAMLWAQVTVEEEIQTDSVDVFARQEVSEKSSALAMAASVLLPGLGHQYLDKKPQALGFITAEAALVFGLIYCSISANKLVDDAKAQAWTYAAVEGGSGADNYFWENVGHFMDSEGYNQALELNRDPEIADHKYLADNLQWRWASDSLREEYLATRAKASTLQTVSSFVIAAMVINRLIAFIDARVAGKYAGVRGARSALGGVRVVPNSSGLRLVADF